MAKKQRWVKLGELASEGNFFDTTLNLKLIPGNMVQLPLNFRTSKRTVAAINGGHLEYVDSEDVAEYLKKQAEKVKSAGEEKPKEKSKKELKAELKEELKEELRAELKAELKKELEEADEVTEAKLKKMNKAELLAYILDNDEEAEKEDWEDENKPELLEGALEILNAE